MINQTHLHLLITHLPIFGPLFGGIVLGYGLWTKSDQTKIAAYILFIISSIGAGIAYLTGEAAEETVENIPEIIESIIKQHEDFALISLIALIALGVVALIGLFLTVKKSPFIRPVAIFTFIISLVSFGLIARTGYLGGQIRHTEISSNTTNPAENSETEKGD